LVRKSLNRLRNEVFPYRSVSLTEIAFQACIQKPMISTHPGDRGCGPAALGYFSRRNTGSTGFKACERALMLPMGSLSVSIGWLECIWLLFGAP
jgi:hypothetical protein